MAEFVLGDFVRKSLIDCIENGMFTKEQANNLAQNYAEKGIITEQDVQDVGGAKTPEEYIADIMVE